MYVIDLLFFGGSASFWCHGGLLMVLVLWAFIEALGNAVVPPPNTMAPARRASALGPKLLLKNHLQTGRRPMGLQSVGGVLWEG